MDGRDNAQQQKYNFMERLELYKLAKKPRKQVRLKFDVIQKDALPFLNSQQRNQNEPLKGLQSFVRDRSHFSHSKFRSSYLDGQDKRRVQKRLQASKINEVSWTSNEYSNLREGHQRALATLDINVRLKEISNESLRKYNQVVERAVDFV